MIKSILRTLMCKEYSNCQNTNKLDTPLPFRIKLLKGENICIRCYSDSAENKLIGIMDCSVYTIQKKAEITVFDVIDEYRKNNNSCSNEENVGKKMMDMVKEEAKQRGIKIIEAYPKSCNVLNNSSVTEVKNLYRAYYNHYGFRFCDNAINKKILENKEMNEPDNITEKNQQEIEELNVTGNRMYFEIKENKEEQNSACNCNA